jgi:uroporphyrinogen decarboxylase
MVDCDGNVNALIPLFLEGGVNCMYPFEARANMDVLAVRRQYGQRLSIIGGVDKTALSKGREEIVKEVESKVPPLAKTAGYIPSVDHGVPSDVTFGNYAYYIELLKSCVTTV